MYVLFSASRFRQRIEYSSNRFSRMVDLIPVVLLALGLISAFKPEWVAAVHRHQKVTGTTNRPKEIEVTDTWIGITRISGMVFIIFGLLFTVQSI